jgi:hypothetical protein
VSEFCASFARPQMIPTAMVMVLANLLQSCTTIGPAVRAESGPGGSKMAQGERRIPCLMEADFGVYVRMVDPDAVRRGCHVVRLPPDLTHAVRLAPVAAPPPAAVAEANENGVNQR